MESVVPLYLAVFLLFAAGAFFVPARLAMVPALVVTPRLASANSWLTASGMVGSMVILLAGALLIEWGGTSLGCLVNAASYLASACFITRVKLSKEKANPPPKGSLGKIFSEIQEGLRELIQRTATRHLTLLVAFLMAGAGASVVAGTVLVQTFLGSLTKDLGFFSLWLGLGMLVGALVYGRWGTRFSHRGVLGAAFLGCGVGLWAFTGAVVHLRSGVGACAAAWWMGLWLAPMGIIVNTLIHESHPQRFHGRIFSSLGAVINVSLMGSMLTAGRLVEEGGHGVLLFGIGSAFFLGGVSLCYTKKRAFELFPKEGDTR